MWVVEKRFLNQVSIVRFVLIHDRVLLSKAKRLDAVLVARLSGIVYWDLPLAIPRHSP